MKILTFRLFVFSLGSALSLMTSAEPYDNNTKINDYPTTARVDYVIGCMASNGQTHEMMHKCSCSIDLIAQAIPYEEYVQISTLLSLQQMTAAGRNAAYKNSTWSQKAIAKLRDVQADSTLSCF
jgi:hypothetical protein